MLDRPEAPVMHAALRVAAVNGDQVALQLPRTFYDKMRGVDDDIIKDHVARPGYFASEQMTVPRASLAKMYTDGVARGITRP